MGERIREIRKALGMTLEQFGERIGISAQSVSRIETGINNPSEQTIRAIIREFDVNEYWLRTGEGTGMFVKKSPEEELSAFFGSIIKSGTDDSRRRLITALSKLGPDEWDVLRKIADDMYETGRYSEKSE